MGNSHVQFYGVTSWNYVNYIRRSRKLTRHILQSHFLSPLIMQVALMPLAYVDNTGTADYL